MNNENELTKDNIISTATCCIKKYVDVMGWKKPEDVIINIDDIYKSVVYPEYEITLITDEDLGSVNEQKILGKTIIDERVILIDREIAQNQGKGDPRFTFTFGHEMGHGICHNQSNQLFRCTNGSIHNNQDPYETQANYFAASLIMPSSFVGYRYTTHYNTNKPFRYIGVGYYCINGKDTYIHSIRMCHY